MLTNLAHVLSDTNEICDKGQLLTRLTKKYDPEFYGGNGERSRLFKILPCLLGLCVPPPEGRRQSFVCVCFLLLRLTCLSLQCTTHHTPRISSDASTLYI